MVAGGPSGPSTVISQGVRTSARRAPRIALPAVLCVVAWAAACARPAAPPPAPAAAASAAADPAARAEQAALYALPLVIMDLTREQFFADPIAVDATPGRFLHIPILGNPTFRAVVRPNVDTLYSTAWLELGDEPVLLTLPPSNGRYFLVQCMDAWTNVFAAPGIRTLGDRAARYAIVGPGWHGEVPAGVELVRSPTRMAWLLGRIYVRDPADLGAARAFQRQLDLRPASRAGDAAWSGVYPHPRDPSAPPRRIMRELVRALGPEALFERFARLTAGNPPAPDDAPFVRDVLAPLGLAPGRALRWASLSEASRSALTAGLERALHALEDRAEMDRRRAVTPTGWSSLGDVAIGAFGTSYAARAGVAAIGLGANLREDAIYLNANVDAGGRPLDGGQRYRLRFAADQAPPVRAFWSVTLYDEQGYLVANPAERYAVKSGDDPAREPDGSLVIYLQPDDPGPAHRANWLPTPDHQRFELSLRAYWPGEPLLRGAWIPPAVTPAP